MDLGLIKTPGKNLLIRSGSKLPTYILHVTGLKILKKL